MQTQNQAAENKNTEDDYWSTSAQVTVGILIIGGTFALLFGNLFI